MSNYVTTTEHEERKYILLEPGNHPARTGPTYQLQDPYILAVVQAAMNSEYLAVDWETKGNDYSIDISIIGVGLAWSGGSCYFHWSNLTPIGHDHIINLLNNHAGLISHNSYFDSGVARKCLGITRPWRACTLALYQLLHNETPENKHGLKQAMTDLLGWSDSNEYELDKWLVLNGYYIGVRRTDESPANLELQWNEGKLKPDKGEMWRVPAEILGHYCVLDAEACYLLYTEILRPTLRKFPELDEYFHDKWMGHIDIHIDQRILGIQVDRPGLLKRKQYLEDEVERTTDKFVTDEDVVPHVRAIEYDLRKEVLNTSPERLRKDGEVSKNWIKWNDKCKDILAGRRPEYNFNINSGPQLRKLLYDGLGYEVRIRTESNEPSVGKKAYIHMGEAGQLLTERADLVKELSYIDKYIELTEHRSSIHPGFRIPGPVTGRVSSNNPNVTQIPKSRAVMELFRAPPGMVFVDIDFCLHPDTEYLTKRGWLTIRNLEDSDEVWQVNPDTRVGSWVVPSRIIRREYSGKMYTIGNRRGNLRVTENHRMLWVNQQAARYTPRYCISEVQKGIPNTALATMLTSSFSDIRGYCPTYHELNTVCLLQADSWYDGEQYHVQLSMPEKRKEAAHLLGKQGRVYPPRSFQNLEVEHWGNIKFTSQLLRGKSLYLENLDTVNADALVSCLSTWDGHTGRSGEQYYYSTDYESIDQVQRYLVRCGYECRLGGHQPSYPGSKFLHKLTIRKAKGLRLRKGIDDVYNEDYSGLVGCVTVPDGCILVRSEGQTFVTGNCALESVVAAEFSQDPNLLSLYGNGVPENDIHLFVAASVPGEMGDSIRRSGYTPINPKEGTVSAAKKDCKHWRNIAKTVVYACQFGAGVNKVMQTLEEEDVFLPYEQVAIIHSTYWQTFAQLKDFGKSLWYEWRRNKGYILNGLGRPMAVPEHYTKDLLSRFIQSTGHDILVTYVNILMGLLNDSGIEWQPVIMDLHDACTIAVPSEYEGQAMQAMTDAMALLNDELNGTIRMRGSPTSGPTLSEVKEPSE